MVLSVSVQAQLRRGENIGLIFVQYWEKTILHSLGHRHGGPLCRLGQVLQYCGQVLETLLLLLLQPLQEFVDGVLHLLLVRSSIHVFFIALVLCLLPIP